MKNIYIRMATEADTKVLLNIYTPYVNEGSVTFENKVPTETDFASRIKSILTTYPYIVACTDKKSIVGFTYANSFRLRAAYNWSVETSIYVKQEYRGQKIGKTLYSKLEEILRIQNITNLYACIAFPNPESIAFHKSVGYQIVGHFTQCAYISNRWRDIIWMEKKIAKHISSPYPMIPINQIKVF